MGLNSKFRLAFLLSVGFGHLSVEDFRVHRVQGTQKEIVLIPLVSLASLALNLFPSHFSFNSFGLTKTRTSLYLGSGLSGNKIRDLYPA